MGQLSKYVKPVIVEKGEYVKTHNGKVLKVSNKVPTHDEPVLLDGDSIKSASKGQGGLLLNNIQSVVSATQENRNQSDKSYTVVDDSIKLRSKEAQDWAFNKFGVKIKNPKKSISFSKVIDLVKDVVDKKTNLYKEAFPNTSDALVLNAAKANKEVLQTLPQLENIYDTALEEQESRKLNVPQDTAQVGYLLNPPFKKKSLAQIGTIDQYQKSIASDRPTQFKPKFDISKPVLQAPQSTLKATQPQSTSSKAYQTLLHPMTAMQHIVENGELPDHFEKGEHNTFDSMNPLKMVHNTLQNLAHPIDTVKKLRDSVVGTTLKIAGDDSSDFPIMPGMEVVGDALGSYGAFKSIEKPLRNSVLNGIETLENSKPFKAIDTALDQTAKTLDNSYLSTKEVLLNRLSKDKIKPGTKFLKEWYDNKTTKEKLFRLSDEDLYAENYNHPPEDIKFNSFVNHSHNDKYKILGQSRGDFDNLYLNYGLHSKANPLNSTVVHEGTHALTSNGQMFTYYEEAELLKPFNFTPMKYNVKQKIGELSKDEAYYLNPTEIHARMNEARFHLNKTPEDLFTAEEVSKLKQENDFFGMGKFIQDDTKMADLLNKFYATAPVIGAGVVASQATKKQQGGNLTFINKNDFVFQPDMFNNIFDEQLSNVSKVNWKKYKTILKHPKQIQKQNFGSLQNIESKEMNSYQTRFHPLEIESETKDIPGAYQGYERVINSEYNKDSQNQYGEFKHKYGEGKTIFKSKIKQQGGKAKLSNYPYMKGSRPALATSSGKSIEVLDGRTISMDDVYDTDSVIVKGNTGTAYKPSQKKFIVPINKSNPIHVKLHNITKSGYGNLQPFNQVSSIADYGFKAPQTDQYRFRKKIPSKEELLADQKSVAARNKKIVQDRYKNIDSSIAARKQSFSPNNIAQRTQAIGDKFRIFPNDPNSFVDDFLNPGVMIGDLASGIGQIPKNIQEGNYGKAALNFAAPVVVGALAGIGAKTTSQFVNNLVNPLAGIKKSNFKSEIDWGNWNKEILDNPQLMKEYNTIEQTSKANGSWMKNPDGSTFQGTPEQFVQQNSENFKKAFPEYHGEILNHNTNAELNTIDESFFNKGAGDTGYYGKGTYAHPKKEYTKMYGKNNYELYLNSKNKGFLDKSNIDDAEYFKRSDNEILQHHLPEYENKLMNYKLDPSRYYDNAKENWLNKLNEQVKAGKISRDKLDEFTSLHNPKNGEVVIPFNNRVKSAVGNNGMFDMTNPNIYKALIPAAVVGTSAINKKQTGGKAKLSNYPYMKGSRPALPTSNGKSIEVLDGRTISMDQIYDSDSVKVKGNQGTTFYKSKLKKYIK